MSTSCTRSMWSLRLCLKTPSGFERLAFRLAASGCIVDTTNIACFAVFARRKNGPLSGRRRNFPTKPRSMDEQQRREDEGHPYEMAGTFQSEFAHHTEHIGADGVDEHHGQARHMITQLACHPIKQIEREKIQDKLCGLHPAHRLPVVELAQNHVPNFGDLFNVGCKVTGRHK